MTRRPYDWTQEELDDRQWCLDGFLMCGCLVGIIPCFAFGAWWTIRGDTIGWFFFSAAAVLAVLALYIGLEDDQ